MDVTRLDHDLRARRVSHCFHCGLALQQEARFCPACGQPQPAVDAGGPAAEEPALHAGRLVAGRYQLVELLGQSAAGALYRSVHTSLGRSLVVRILPETSAIDDALLREVASDVTAAVALRNPHLVEVFDCMRDDDGRVLLIMEHLEGCSLRRLLARDQQLPVPRTLEILRQVGSALMELHALGQVHGGLQPRDVFLTVRHDGGGDLVKLLNLGLNRLLHGAMRAGSTALLGYDDLRYCSPEQAHGAPGDRRVDVYAMGVLAYEMLVGEPPFEGGQAGAVLERVLTAPRPSVRKRRIDCPLWLDAAIQCALAQSPEDRFVTVLRFLEHLEQGQPPPVSVAQVAPTSSRTLPNSLLAPPATAVPSRDAQAVAPSPVQADAVTHRLPIVVARALAEHSATLPLPDDGAPPRDGGNALVVHGGISAAAAPAVAAVPRVAGGPELDHAWFDVPPGTDETAHEPSGHPWWREHLGLLIGAAIGGIFIVLVLVLAFWPRPPNASTSSDVLGASQPLPQQPTRNR